VNVHLTPKSSNAKTGPIPVSTSSAATCPKVCPFNSTNEGGCYAASGPLALHWAAVTRGDRGMSWGAFTQAIAGLPADTLWRHNQAGDLPGNGYAIDAVALAALVAANHGKRGFTYTHYVTEPSDDTDIPAANAAAVAAANRAGFTVNLSGNDLAHADRLADLAIAPVVVVLPSDVDGKATPTVRTPAGRTVVVCPATYRDDVSCATCQLCQRQRSTVVGFPAHGTGKKRADRVARVIPIRAA
jgi:hypothetical protein